MPTKMIYPRLLCGLLSASSVLALSACSSGKNGSNGSGGGLPRKIVEQPKPEPQWTPGVYKPAWEYAGLCATPKEGINPFTEQPYGHSPGTAMHEKLWIRSMSNDLYLWYDLLRDPNPEPFSVINYFKTLKADFDIFFDATPVEDYFNSLQSGVQLDHGVRWSWQSVPEVALRVADIDEGYDLNGVVSRGDTLLAVNGVELGPNATRAEIKRIEAGLNPTEDDPNHVFTLRDHKTGLTKDVMLTARALAHNPVPRVHSFDHNGDTFGYLQFDAHTAIASDYLIEAVNELQSAHIDELILDLRYNGGGSIAVASQLSYMVAGAGVTDGMPFIFPKYNDKHTEINPLNGKPIEAIPFLNQHQNDLNEPYSLPTLELSRIYVLTSKGTCSASEAIINGLKGVGVDVVQIGNATCGKPYTFQPLENCGILYSSVLFSNENALGFGDYIKGFQPTDGSAEETQSRLPGCTGNDDMDHPLGDLKEQLLAKALYWHEHDDCPSATKTVPFMRNFSLDESKQGLIESAVNQQQPYWKSNALMPANGIKR